MNSSKSEEEDFEEDSNNSNNSGEELSIISDKDSDSNENSDVSNTSNNESNSEEDEISENLIPSPLLGYSPTIENLRDYYMSQLTNGFGEDLDKIRKEQNLDSNRLEVLIDSLESGIKIFSDIERELILLSSSNNNK
ncbi:11229_t:CDS:2 [Entrophospora sp. SA101]|nr:5803_t:CDS:2 [Entrophospora sp. SA101]CAJ0646884.1 11229_t:CDS:2 [Entrophospora sp. SA101]CAJ0828699.1 3432_t:CDS:2 [Entrophospora sp. SA101]